MIRVHRDVDGPGTVVPLEIARNERYGVRLRSGRRHELGAAPEIGGVRDGLAGSDAACHEPAGAVGFDPERTFGHADESPPPVSVAAHAGEGLPIAADTTHAPGTRRDVEGTDPPIQTHDLDDRVGRVRRHEIDHDRPSVVDHDGDRLIRRHGGTWMQHADDGQQEHERTAHSRSLPS